jgi:hypothetical protein
VPYGTLASPLCTVNATNIKICVASNNLEIDFNDVLETIKILLQSIISQKQKHKKLNLK